MRLHQLFSSLLIRWFGDIVVVFSAFSVMYAQSPTAPTASEEPAKIDHIWQKASSKYDAERAALLREVDVIANQGPFRPDWESLQKYEAPEWYQDAKFGIFIHWGAYSVPAFGNEWYPRNMYEPGFDAYKHHIATYGQQDKFGYKDFIPMFKAEHFDPSAWAELFKKAGAKYVVPVAEHHDGFAMYDSGLSDWTAAKMGPHRDVIGDLSKAVRAEGLHFGVSSHRVEHDDSPSGVRRLRLTCPRIGERCSWVESFLLFPYLESLCFCSFGSPHAASCCLQDASALIPMAQMKPNSSRATAVMVFLCSLPRAISVM